MILIVVALAGDGTVMCLGGGMSDEPLVRDMPVGIGASGHRRESDSMGVIHVPADRYWGAQTQRSLIHFGDIGPDPMPPEVCHALVLAAYGFDFDLRGTAGARRAPGVRG